MVVLLLKFTLKYYWLMANGLPLNVRSTLIMLEMFICLFEEKKCDNYPQCPLLYLSCNFKLTIEFVNSLVPKILTANQKLPDLKKNSNI